MTDGNGLCGLFAALAGRVADFCATLPREMGEAVLGILQGLPEYDEITPYPEFDEAASAFGLSGFEQLAAALALAAQTDATWGNVLLALGTETSAPTLGLALHLYTSDPIQRYALWSEWLARSELLDTLFPPSDAPRTLHTPLTLHPNFLRLLLAVDSLDALLDGADGLDGIALAGRLCHKLSSLATPVQTAFGWEDLVLPEAQFAQLRLACHQVRCRDTVYRDWGFGAKSPYGRGVRMLFSGPPGTGKTMAAQVMAGELGMTLYKVDLSRISSKYIGETEKNLSALFEQARHSGAILFFDEADALFGKRGEQRDSHDRYANMQTAFLLQQFEDYDGVSILCTNLAQNFDPAFRRRIQCQVEFVPPGVRERRLMWEKLRLPGAPFAGEVDFDFLAEMFALSGAEIKNIVLNAAFRAAGAGTTIGMEQLIHALLLELGKSGRLVTPSELGRYAKICSEVR